MATPGLPAQLQYVLALLQRGELTSARRAVDQLKASHATTGDVWALDGEIAIRQGRLGDAVASVNRASALEPELPERHIQKARCLVMAGDVAGARSAALAALGCRVARLDHLLVLGGVLVRCSEQHRALEIYRQAAALAPESPDAQRGLASVHRFLGDIHQAEAACDAAIRLDPLDYETIGLRSSLRAATHESNHIASLRALQADGIRGWRGEVQVAFALAKEYEDLGDYAQSFACLQQGAGVKRRHTRYDLEDDLRIFPALCEAFSGERMARAQEGHESSEPIFVLGMPRTGSTLVERIVSSHSQVQSLGELSTLSIEMMRLVEEGLDGKKLERSRLPQLAAALPMRALAERYLQGVAPLRDGRSRFIDKLPLNSLNVGLIHLAFPRAAIVHVVRDPMDACYAMFKYLFRNGYPFSYDLTELGAYYAAYHRLMSHWRTVLPPGRIIDIAYEDLVGDLPGQAPQLVSRLDLPWEPACEAFHRNRNPSMTGSAAQVRRPVYSASIGRWRNLERELAPLRAALVAGGVPLA